MEIPGPVRIILGLMAGSLAVVGGGSPGSSSGVIGVPPWTLAGGYSSFFLELVSQERLDMSMGLPRWPWVAFSVG